MSALCLAGSLVQQVKATGFDFKPICAALPGKASPLSSILFKSYKKDAVGLVKRLDNGYYVRDFGSYYCVISPEISELKYLKASARLVKIVLEKAGDNGELDATCEINGRDLDSTCQSVLKDVIEARLGVTISNDQIKESAFTFGFFQIVSYSGPGFRTSVSPGIRYSEEDYLKVNKFKHNWSVIYDLEKTKLPFVLNRDNIKYFPRPFSDYSINFFNYTDEIGDSGSMASSLVETAARAVRLERFELAKEVRELAKKVAARLPMHFTDFFSASVSEDQIQEHKRAMELEMLEKKKSPQEIEKMLSSMVFSERNLCVELRTLVKFSNVEKAMGPVSVQIWP